MKLFYELLQISVGTLDTFEKLPTEEEWMDIYFESERQCLLGVMFTGIEKTVKHYSGLNNIGMNPDLFATWYSCVQKIEEQNQELNKKSAWLQKWLLNQGLCSCILKGQGNALLYPEISRRMSGDIDVWVWFKDLVKSPLESKYRGYENRLRFIKWVQKRMNGKFAEIGIHHIHLEPLGDIEVEGHYWPTYLFCFSNMKTFERWCEDKFPQFMNNWQQLPDGAGEISVPTREFNMIFQLIHIMRHFFHDGMGLRQMLDYYWLINSDNINYEEVKEMVNKLNLNNIIEGMMWVMKEVFAMDESKLPFKTNEAVGQLMLNEMERGGNLGHDDTGIAKWRYESKLKIFVWRTWRNIKFMSICPTEVLWCIPFRIWQFFWIRRMYKMGNVNYKEAKQ